MKCEVCEEEIEEEDLAQYDPPLCYDCLDMDRQYGATVKIFNADDMYDGYEGEDGSIVCCVGEYINETNDEFKMKYVHTDAWRGYVDITSDDWTEVHDDVILSFSQDAMDLEEFYDEFREIMDAQLIPYAVAFCPTSNVFSVNMSFFTKNEFEAEVNEIIERLLEVHRNPENFIKTALTGADPEDLTPEDEAFVQIARTLL